MTLESDLKLWKTKMAVGRMAYEAGMFRQASQHFQRALDLVEEKKLPDELRSQTLVNLAKTLGSIGRFDEGEKLLRRALQIDETTANVDADFAVELIEDYHQLSLLYWRAGKPDLAQQPLKKAFDLLATHQDVPDELTAKLMKHKAVLAELSGDYKLCEKLLDEALDFIRESSELGKHSSLYGDCLMVKVMLLTDLDRYDDAVEIYEEAKQILEISRGAAHPKMLELLEALIELAHRKGRTKEAEALHKQACDIKTLLKGRDEY
jgi:tetratricopeptide (TPR) repeat protein